MRWIVVLLLGTNALLVGWVGWATSPNKTETGHMAATVYFWHTLRFDVFHVNPPLTRMVSGLPVSLCQPKYDWSYYSPKPQTRSEWGLGTIFVKANRPEKVRWCFALARWALIPFLLVGGYFGYRLSREIYGNTAAVLFLILWCLSPSLLSWGATICPDAVATALGLVAIYAFRQWLHGPTWLRAAMAGACLGLLPLSKLTWIIAFGLWPLIWFLWTAPSWLNTADKHSLPRPPLRQLAVILIVGLYTLNVGYMFDGTCRPLGKYVFISQSLHGQEVAEGQPWPTAADNRFADTWLAKISVPLPAEFVQGIDTQRLDFERGIPSYLRGTWAYHGWWYYYLYALAVKVPLGTLCLVGLALGVTIFGRGFNAPWRDEMVVLIPGLVILVFVSSQTGFSVHSRYVIPALPFFFIWISKVARVFEMKKGTVPICAQHPPGRSGKWGPSPFSRAMKAMVVVALTWSVGSSLWAYPHSMSYFNELAGGPKGGGEHLMNSNIDHGQDLLYLKNWLDKHPEVTLDGLAFHGSYPATLAGIPETPHPPPGPPSDNSTAKDGRATNQFGPKPGWYAVSVNYLYGRSRQYRYFLDFEPAASAGYSIYIYHVTLEDANRVRRELELPEIQEAKARQTTKVKPANTTK